MKARKIQKTQIYNFLNIFQQIHNLRNFIFHYGVNMDLGNCIFIRLQPCRLLYESLSHYGDNISSQKQLQNSPA